MLGSSIMTKHLGLTLHQSETAMIAFTEFAALKS
jgi:hypothetical protein